MHGALACAPGALDKPDRAGVIEMATQSIMPASIPLPKRKKEIDKLLCKLLLQRSPRTPKQHANSRFLYLHLLMLIPQSSVVEAYSYPKNLQQNSAHAKLVKWAADLKGKSAEHSIQPNKRPNQPGSNYMHNPPQKNPVHSASLTLAFGAT